MFDLAYVSVSPSTVHVTVTLTEAEAISLSHRLNIGRNALANAKECYASGKLKPSDKRYADKYDVTSSDLAANSGGTLEDLQNALSAKGFGPVRPPRR